MTRKELRKQLGLCLQCGSAKESGDRCEECRLANLSVTLTRNKTLKKLGLLKPSGPYQKLREDRLRSEGRCTACTKPSIRFRLCFKCRQKKNSQRKKRNLTNCQIV